MQHMKLLHCCRINASPGHHCAALQGSPFVYYQVADQRVLEIITGPKGLPADLLTQRTCF